MADSFDVVVIGSGPGGYVCAIRAAQLGLKVACVEKNDTLGGTCLNVGCIPSKAMLHASEAYDEVASGHFAKIGVKTSGLKLDLKAVLAHKDEAISSNTKGIEFLFKKNKVTHLQGIGKITGPGKVEVKKTPRSKAQIVDAKNIVIATGSAVAQLPGIKIDEESIVSSTGALCLKKVPKHLLIVGAGVIGLELGSVWRRLGSEVTVVEFLDRIIPGMDGEVAKVFQRSLKKQGFKFKLSTKVTGIEKKARSLKATVEPAKGGKAETITCDAALIAIGRVPYTAGLGLAEAGVTVDDRGRVTIDGNFQTNVAGIYAIGDAVEGPMLAHKAEDEGVAVAEIMAGQAGGVNHDVIPGVIYTWPEVASVGKTEEELKDAGVAFKSGKFPFSANGRARIAGMTDGFVKVLADKTTDRVLGVHMLGPNVSEMIAEAALAMEFGASAEDIARTCHAHPTLTEAMKEAALAAGDGPIHM